MQYIEMQHACRLWLLKVNNSRDHEHSLLWQFYGASLNLPAVVDIVFVAHLVSRSFRHLHFTMAWDLFRLLIFGFLKWNFEWMLVCVAPGLPIHHTNRLVRCADNNRMPYGCDNASSNVKNDDSLAKSRFRHAIINHIHIHNRSNIRMRQRLKCIVHLIWAVPWIWFIRWLSA